MKDAIRKAPKIKHDRGFIMSSAWYTQIGNNFSNWATSASNLFAASMILRQEEEKERKRVIEAHSSVGPVSVAINTDAAQRLLTAFGLEALLKAVWLKSGNKLVDDGEYIGLPCENTERPKWHNLVAICDDVCVTLETSERHILRSLSESGRYQGRYPIARQWEHMEPVFYWSEEWDNTIRKLITKLWRRLEIPIQGPPIGGMPLSKESHP